MSIAMDLAPTRFTTIDGQDVSVRVNSASEAKTALKELRHKKRELNLLKRGILRERKRTRAKQTKARRPSTYWQRLVQTKTGLLGWLMGFVRNYQARRPVRKLETLEQELQHIEDLVHKVDDCILQIEGQLIHNS